MRPPREAGRESGNAVRHIGEVASSSNRALTVKVGIFVSFHP